MLIQSIELPVPGLVALSQDAHVEGYDFVHTLLDQWEDGQNGFNKPGEWLCGAFDKEELVAVGGLTIDPFVGRADVGRVRRVYVRPAWRNQGIGRALVSTLVEEARESFACVRLRAENADAARL